VCSATGFVDGSGDPFCNADGALNAQLGIHPEAMLERQILYGVREMLTYAGFGYTTAGIVEPLGYRDFVVNRKGKNR
jgi:hypothetical protein